MKEQDDVPYSVYKKPLVAAIGNPLFDIVVPLPSMELLKKCNITGKKVIGEEEFRVLYEQVQKRKDLNTWPGGSSQITAQSFQWVVGEPGYAIVLGNVGSDAVGKDMESQLVASGAQARYTALEGQKTGVCLNFTCGAEKASVAYLGAAAKVSTAEHLLGADRQNILKNVQIMFVEGFFVAHSFLVAKELITLCRTSGIYLALNLNSTGLVNDYSDQMLEMVANCDMVFGNVREFRALAGMAKWKTTNTKEIIQAILKHSHSYPDKFKRQSLPALFHNMPLIVVTDGPNPVTLRQGKRPSEEFQVRPLLPDEVVDETGSGDAFVGGFLAAAVLGLEMQECVDWGSQTASAVLRTAGVHLPKGRPAFVQGVAKRIRPFRKTSVSTRS